MEFNIMFLCGIITLIGSIESATIFTSILNATGDDLETIFTSVVFRHGDRAPDNNGHELYPMDPYKNYDFYPEGFGGLTAAGKRRAYELGSVLRSEYDNLLGEIYMPSMVIARSTDYYRTKMSLLLVLAALYPPKKKQIWNPNLNWQPIPMSYSPAHEDNLMLADECLRYDEELKRVKNLKEVQVQVGMFGPLMKNLTQWTGKDIKSTFDMFNLYHSLMAEYSMNLTLPEWVYTIFPDGQLWDATILEYKIENYNTKLRRLYGGILLRNITDTMLDIASGRINDSQKIYLFSGHETNMAAFLHTLGIYKPHVPEYSSAVFVELNRDRNGKYYVRLKYYLGIPSKLQVLRLPECDENCPLNDFVHLLKDVIPSDEERHCTK